MKHFILSAIFVIASFIFTSCEKEQMMSTTNDYYVVQLGWSGELDITYEPLTKSHDRSNLYGIQVYSSPDVFATAENTVWTPYAHGLFDNTDEISISLLKGYKYKFITTMIVDGKDMVYSANSEYHFPFFVGGTNTAWCTLNNLFNYSSIDSMNVLSNGKTTLSNHGNFLYPNTERYYGELVDFIPQKNNAKANVHLKRVCFGAKFMVKGKVATNGVVTAQIQNAPELSIDLTGNEKKISDIFTFSDVKTTWENNSYREEINVCLNWLKDNGVTVPLGTHTVEFKRNATTVVHINIDEEGLSGCLGFEYDDIGEMEVDNEVVIQDGEIVETDVNTNH